MLFQLQVIMLASNKESYKKNCISNITQDIDNHKMCNIILRFATRNE